MNLHLGCGTVIRADWINLDIRDLPGVNIVRDILRGLPFSDDVVDEIYSENFLEHIPQAEVIWVMNECWRVLKMGGVAAHIIPLAGTDNDFGDPTHLSHWSENTITYFNHAHLHWSYYSGIKPWSTVSHQLSPRAFKVVMTKV